MKDYNVVISGATRGIGREIALTLAEYGANIAFNYYSSDTKASELKLQIEELGRICYAEKFDIRDRQACKEFSKNAKDRLGKIDVLINNAGIVKDKSFVLMSEDEWSQVIDTNLTGTYHITKAFIFDFIKRKKGSIINISSITGITGAKQQANYSASKAGVNGLTKSLAKELAEYNIRVNAIAPGYITTDMTDGISEKIREEFLKGIPLGRFGDAKEVADFVLFLVSGGDSYITGQVFSIDGGLTI